MSEIDDEKHPSEALIARLNQNPRDIEAAVTLGNMYYDQDEAAQSILYYNVALDVNPNQPGVRTDMGTMYWKNGNVSFAERAFRQVVQEFPGFGNAYLNLGYLLLHAKNEVKEARRFWQQLVDQYPDEAATEQAEKLLKETFN